MGVMFICREEGENCCEILTQQCGKVCGLFSSVLCAVEETPYRGMYVFNILIVFISLNLCRGAFERDLLLTPKEGLQIRGKRVFYRPGNNETGGSIPWEQTLKHVTYLTLFKNGEGEAKISDTGKYNKFMQSPYTRAHKEYPKFGDIITIAQGFLEKVNEYRFIEGFCERHCESVLALWRVQKIRHRDSQRGFRYEMKFSVTPVKDVNAKQNRIRDGEQYLKSFILKDDDYPESFSAVTRRSDQFETFSNERQARIVNEHPESESMNTHALNIGEYFRNTHMASPKAGYHSETFDMYPTTYRPNYHVKFPKPETYEQPETPKTVVTHHFHHHFFMNDPESHLLQEQPKFLENLDAIHIIDAPKPDALMPRLGGVYITTPSPSPLKKSVLHTIPIFRQISHQEESTTQAPFRQSEQQIEQIRYSDPDPLYANEGLGSGRISAETASAEVHLQVERQQSITELQVIKDDSKHEDLTAIKESEHSSTTKQTKISLRTRPTNSSALLSEKPHGYFSKVSINKYRSYPRSTTEQPVLRWKPKRKPAEKTFEQQSKESSQENLVIVTPSNSNATDFQVHTEKSVSASISVKVGNYSQEIHLTEKLPTTTEESSKA